MGKATHAKGILWFAKDRASIKTTGIFFSPRKLILPESVTPKMAALRDDHYNLELDVFTYAFHHSRWTVYWTCMDDIDQVKKRITLYNPLKEEFETVSIDKLDELVQFVTMKYLGSVEAQRDRIVKTLKFLKTHFHGTIVNHPDTIEYATRKDYLVELKNAGFPVEQGTMTFPNTVTYPDLLRKTKKLGKPDGVVVKPITGELANSLSLLEDVTPKWLRAKESKVGGWIAQTLMPDVWNGEYRLVFLGNVCSHAMRKKYYRIDDDQKLPSEAYRVFEEYHPQPEELDLARRIRHFWETKLKKKIYFFRFDFVKSRKGQITVLEFETLNPGFGFGALSEELRQKVAREYVSFLQHYTF